jgi:hypothetical protein
MPTKEPKFSDPPKPPDDGPAEPGQEAQAQPPQEAAPPPPPKDPATSGDAPLVAPLVPAQDQSQDPAVADLDQLNTATPPPKWPESTEVKSRPGEPGQGETDPALVPPGHTSPTPAG